MCTHHVVVGGTLCTPNILKGLRPLTSQLHYVFLILVSCLYQFKLIDECVCYVMLCYAMLCYAMSCNAMLCYGCECYGCNEMKKTIDLP